jgi:LPXTG-motif cell wall-anchored protein
MGFTNGIHQRSPVAKRLITALLGASLVLALSVSGAGAAEPAAKRQAFTDAIEKLSSRRDAAVDAVIQPLDATSDEVGQPPASGGEEPPDEGCLGGKDPAIKELRAKLRKAARAVLNKDETVAELDAALGSSADAYFTVLETATSSARINDAFGAFAEVIEAWDNNISTRIVELKPEYAALVETFLAELEEAGACERVIERAAKRLDGGQAFVDRNVALTHEAAAAFLAFAELARDEALALLEEEPGDGGDGGDGSSGPRARPNQSLPETGASALPLLLGGLALIAGGTTALLVARRRRATA